MKVIDHQAVRVTADAKPFRRHRQPVQEIQVVFGVQKDVLPRVAAGHDVTRNTGQVKAKRSRHRVAAASQWARHLAFPSTRRILERFRKDRQASQASGRRI
jgi:hypothetical protein